MTFNSVLKKYLTALSESINHAQKSGEFTPELSFRPALHEFFLGAASSINPKIKIVYEPRNQSSSGRPDWRFHNADNFGVYGYCEAKGLNLNEHLDIASYDEQIKKYLMLKHKLILTDGIDFIFIHPKQASEKRISLTDKPTAENKLLKIMSSSELERAFREFFGEVRARKCSEEDLVANCALRAAQLAGSVRELVSLSEGSGLTKQENETIGILKKLQNILVDHQDENLRTPEAFADFVAQVLIFGLIYAHRTITFANDAPLDRLKKIHNFWVDVLYKEKSGPLRPFKALINSLGNELSDGSMGPVGVWYNDCRLMLAHVDLSVVQKERPDYHILFERFLTAYDPSTRFNYGAFYTPQCLSWFAVRLVQSIINSRAEGFNIFGKGNKLIDPCCGTGSFIEQLIRAAGKQEIHADIVGLEILPGPYALAHYRLNMLNHAAYPSEVRILLTDTLSDSLINLKKTSYDKNDFALEQAEARSYSKAPLTLVIGNPPSVDPEHQIERDGGSQIIISKLLDDWRPPEEARTSRQNIQKQINNDFVKFLRWSCDKLGDNSRGMVVFVLPGSFADKPSYKYARKWLVEFFDDIWVMTIDSDSRRGIDSENLFATLQGRMLLLGYRDGITKKREARVQCHSIEGLSKSKKIEFLSQERSSEQLLKYFSAIVPKEPSWPLKPMSSCSSDIYKKFWPISAHSTDSEGAPNAIFARTCSGVKLAPTSLFTHVNNQVLLRKLGYVADSRNTYRDIIDAWFAGQHKRPSESKISASVRAVLVESLKTNAAQKTFRYSYRPFVDSHVFFDKKVLSALASQDEAGGGTRYRPEIVAAFLDSNTFGIALTPSPEDVSGGLHRFVSFCWNLPDNDLSKRGNGRICCNQFPFYKKAKTVRDLLPQNNINGALTKYFSKSLKLTEKASANAVVFYTYAILCSDVYLTRFSERLLSGLNDEWPKIPIVKDPNALKTMVDLGKKLAELEKSDNARVNSVPESVKKNIKAGFRLEASRIDGKAKSLYLLGRAGKSKEIVSLEGITEEVLAFQVSGYFPIQQWLKIHSYAYSRMEFGIDQVNLLYDLADRIKKQIRITPLADDVVEMIVSGKLDVITQEELIAESSEPFVKDSRGSEDFFLKEVEESFKYSEYLPVYSFAAACGKFGHDQTAQEEGWIKVDIKRDLHSEMFVVRAIGHSMEPKINNGDYCIFEKDRGGTRNGKIVLVECRNSVDPDSGKYTIKKYQSEKTENADGVMIQQKIILIPINKKYKVIELDAEATEEFTVVGWHVESLVRRFM